MAAAARPTILLALPGTFDGGGMPRVLADLADVLVATDEAEVLRLMHEHDVQAVLCGPCPTGTICTDLLARLHEGWPDTQRLLTGDAACADLAEVVNTAHIHQFLPQPATDAQLRLAIAGACRAFQLGRENARLALEIRVRGARPERRVTDTLAEGIAFDAILRNGGSPMNGVIAQAARIASFDVPVLLRGEAATGKTELARAIHRTSLRSDRAFHALDCTGLPDDVLRLELFGARHGALPGLAAARTGLSQKAHRGSLFLDHVEALSPQMQLELLRLLQDGTARAMGSAEAQPAQLRLVAGTAVDLQSEVEAGRFRAEVYFALSVTDLAVPPLRERRADIPTIASEVLTQAAQRHAKPVRGFSQEALEFLTEYDWPGNLRELENEITRMLIAAEGPVLGADLISRPILQHAPCRCVCDTPGARDGTPRDDVAIMAGGGSLRERIEEIEARVLNETLTRLKWNKSRAAAELGLSRVGLRAKLDRYGLVPGPHGMADAGGGSDFSYEKSDQ